MGKKKGPLHIKYNWACLILANYTELCSRLNLVNIFFTLILHFCIFSEPEILEKLQDLLAAYNSSFIMPPSNLPIDPKSRPSLFDHTWSNFGDHNITLPL